MSGAGNRGPVANSTSLWASKQTQWLGLPVWEGPAAVPQKLPFMRADNYQTASQEQVNGCQFRTEGKLVNGE